MSAVVVHPVQRNILFSPRIWGLRFPSMVACMLSIIVGFYLGGGLGLMAKFGLVSAAAGAAYGLLYWRDNRDAVVSHARRHCRIRRVAASYSLSRHFLRIE